MMIVILIDFNVYQDVGFASVELRGLRVRPVRNGYGYRFKAWVLGFCLGPETLQGFRA